MSGWVVAAWSGGRPAERGRVTTWGEADALRAALVEDGEGAPLTIEDSEVFDREQDLLNRRPE